VVKSSRQIGILRPRMLCRRRQAPTPLDHSARSLCLLPLSTPKNGRMTVHRRNMSGGDAQTDVKRTSREQIEFSACAHVPVRCGSCSYCSWRSVKSARRTCRGSYSGVYIAQSAPLRFIRHEEIPKGPLLNLGTTGNNNRVGVDDNFFL